MFLGGQHGAVQPFSDEDASIETLSHCSSFSDTTSVADEGKFVYFCFHELVSARVLVREFDKSWIDFIGGETSEDTAQEDFQYKLKGFIDSTVDKRLKFFLISHFNIIW